VTQTGFEVEPSGRLLWTPTEKQTVWGAVSRSVRTPARIDQDARYNFAVVPPSPAVPLPTLVSILGDTDFHSEELYAYELGYRVQPVQQLSFDLSTFYNVYHDLNINTPSTPFFEGAPVPHEVLPELTSNGGSADTYGAELSAQWRVSDNFKLQGSYSYLHMHLSPSDATAGDSPQNQFQLHAFLNVTREIELNASLYYVDKLPDLNIPAYTRGDLGITWRPNQRWEFSIWGQNLFDANHAEFSSTRTPVITEIPRTFYGKITFRF
jgi:iron complex outermembrane receptor protein